MRQTKTDKIFEAREKALIEEQARIEAELKFVRDLRKEFASPPRSRTKNRVAGVANAQPAAATGKP